MVLWVTRCASRLACLVLIAEQRPVSDSSARHGFAGAAHAAGRPKLPNRAHSKDMLGKEGGPSAGN